MKFRISKHQVDFLSSLFDKNSAPLQEIDLEPVWETAKEAIKMEDIKNRAFNQGYELGYKNGFMDSRNRKCPHVCIC